MDGRASLTAWVVVAVAVVGAGCEDRYEQARREAAAVVVDLPRTQGTGLAEPQPRTRVVVRPGGIDVDQAELVASWDTDHRDALVDATPGRSLKLAWPRVVRLAGLQLRSSDQPRENRYLLPALHTALLAAARVEKQFARFDSEAPFEGHLQILADRDTPFDLLARVLYTAAQAEYADWDLTFAAKGRRAILRIEAPRIGEREHDGCLTPELTVLSSGIQVRARPAGPRLMRLLPTPGTSDAILRALTNAGDGGPPPAPPDAGAPARPPRRHDGKRSQRPEPPPPPPPPGPPAWVDAVMLGPRNACPSVPVRSGHQDLRALVALLGEMGRLAPRCRTARIDPLPVTRWEDLAAILQSVRLQAGYENVHLGVGMDADEPPSCDGGLRP